MSKVTTLDTRPSKLSFIEPHEVADAEKVVNDAFMMASKGKPLKFRVAGYKMLVKIHVRPEELREITDAEGKKVTLYLPDMARAEDKFNSCSGLVLDVGDQAYTGVNRDGSPRYPNGPWCRRGDLVVFNRTAGSRVTICGVACMILNDDQIDGVIDEPGDIEAGHMDFKL